MDQPKTRSFPVKAGKVGLAVGLVVGALFGLLFLTRLSAGDRPREINLRSLTVIAGTTALVVGTFGGFLGVLFGAILADRRKPPDPRSHE